jgi:hypothetical protein
VELEPLERRLLEIAEDRVRLLRRALHDCHMNDTRRWNRLAEDLRNAEQSLFERRQEIEAKRRKLEPR